MQGLMVLVEIIHEQCLCTCHSRKHNWKKHICCFLIKHIAAFVPYYPNATRREHVYIQTEAQYEGQPITTCSYRPVSCLQRNPCGRSIDSFVKKRSVLSFSACSATVPPSCHGGSCPQVTKTCITLQHVQTVVQKMRQITFNFSITTSHTRGP